MSTTERFAGADALPEREAEIRSALALSRIRGIGPMRACRLIQSFGSARSVLSAELTAVLATGLVNEEGARLILQTEPIQGPDRTVSFFQRLPEACDVLLYSDKGYPPALRTISQPPVLMWTKGQQLNTQAPCVALVGSRNATERGRRMAWHWAYRLASAGITVVSGLAQGIDASAHQGALEAGGHTIAVMGTGIDRVYPGRNRGLAKEITQAGTLLSEFDPGTGARPHHFPRRNRIIAGLSQVVVVVEAAKDSGSLITARLAQDEGREVGFVSGRPDDPMSKGTNRAIQDHIGALVTSPEDVMQMLCEAPGSDWIPPPHEHAALQWSAVASRTAQGNMRRTPIRKLSPAARVRDRLQREPASMNQLIADTHLEKGELERVCLDLMLDGRVELGGDQRYCWRGRK